MIKHWAVQQEYKPIPRGILDQAWFMALGQYQLFFFYSWMAADDAAIYEINLLHYSRSSGMQLMDSYRMSDYCKCLNQSGMEIVTLIDNGRKLWYSYQLFYQKGGVLNLQVENDAWCYEQLLIHHIPDEIIRTKFNIINEDKFDFDTFMQNMDISIRSRSRVTPKKEELHPRIYQTHFQVGYQQITQKELVTFYENLKSIYPKPPPRVAGFAAFYHWFKIYENEYQTAYAYIQRKKREETFDFPTLQTFLNTRLYLTAD